MVMTGGLCVYLSNYFFEYIRMFIGNLGKHFAVEFDVFFVKQMNEFAVGKIIFFGCGSHTLLPQSAILSFFELAAHIGVVPCMQKRVMCSTFL